MKRSASNQFDLRNDRKRLGVGLFNLAVSLSRMPTLPTQAQREAMIKSLKRRRKTVDGKTGLRHLRQEVDGLIGRICSNRRKREASRYPGDRRPFSAATRGRPPVRLDPRPMEERLKARVAGAVATFFAAGYRFDVAGPADVEITKDPAKVGVRQSGYLDWDFYSRATKYPKQIVVTTITVPNAWRIRVLARGLALVGGLLTLDAQRLEGAPDGVELYAASWLEQGRGYAVRKVDGFIAREVLPEAQVQAAAVFHAKSLDKAVKGLLRKIGAAIADREIRDLLARHGIDTVVSRHPDLVVTLQDARVTGSCEFGIRSWCNRTGLPYEAGMAPLGDVYAAYKTQPLPEARVAILHALRRNKKAILKAA